MNVTFLTTVRLDDLGDLPGVASEINDDLTQGGFDVMSVVPWARPSLTQVQPTVPTPNQQTQIQPNQQ